MAGGFFNGEIMSTKLTVVYDADTVQDVKALLDAHPWSAMSHSHAIHERDAALREIERLQKRVEKMQEPHAAGHEDAARIAERFEFFALDHTPDGWPAVQQRQLNEAAAELRRLLNLLGKANALAAIRAKRIKELEVQLDAVGAGGVEPLRKRHLDESDAETLDKIMELADMYANAAITDGCPVDRLPRNVLRRAIAEALNQRASDAS